MNVNNSNKENKSLKKKYPHPQMGLSETLKNVFLEKGTLSDNDIKHIAEVCQTDEKNVREIVEHYDYFDKKCANTISVCFGLPCYINGAEMIFNDLQNENQPLNGDGKKVIAASCLGYCHAAPVVLEIKD